MNNAATVNDHRLKPQTIYKWAQEKTQGQATALLLLRSSLILLFDSIIDFPDPVRVRMS